MKTTTPLPEELVPMTPAVFNILLALADRKKHGYAIMQEVETNSGGMVMMGSGTLYGSIKGMLAVGLNEESVECPDLELDDQRHRYYRLTSLGGQVVEAESRRLADLVALAKAKHVMAFEGR